MPGGAGGPDALQTSPPVRRPESVDTYPHAALRALHCRASPGNSSIAGAAPLDSVRLRRNCSLLLCETQSSSLTCARGANRAWVPVRGPSRGDMFHGTRRIPETRKTTTKTPFLNTYSVSFILIASSYFFLSSLLSSNVRNFSTNT